MAHSFTVVSGPRLKPRVYGDGRRRRFSVSCSCSIDEEAVRRCIEENPEACLCYGVDQDNRDPLDILIEEEARAMPERVVAARRETCKAIEKARRG